MELSAVISGKKLMAPDKTLSIFYELISLYILSAGGSTLSVNKNSLWPRFLLSVVALHSIPLNCFVTFSCSFSTVLLYTKLSYCKLSQIHVKSNTNNYSLIKDLHVLVDLIF